MTTIGCGAEEATPSEETAGPEGSDTAAFSDDLEALRLIIDVPGEPVAVRWGPVVLGGSEEGDRVPGPTDVYHLAVIDYGDPAIVTELAADATPLLGRQVVAPWFPDELRELNGDEAFETTAYERMPSFGNRPVGVPVDAANWVVVSYEPPPTENP